MPKTLKQALSAHETCKLNKQKDMTQSTYFNQVKNVLKVLQGYTKGIRFLLVMLLTLCVSAEVWGEEGTINFNSNAVKINAASVNGNDNLGNSWTITTVGTTSFTSNAAYYQVGSSSKPATSITFTTTLPQQVTITGFSAKFGGFNSTAGNVTLKVGDTSVGTGQLNTTSDVTIQNTKEATGKILTVTVTNISKGVKAYYISYTYTTSGDDPEPDPEPGTGGELVGEQTATYVVSNATAVTTLGIVPDGSSASLSGTGSLNGGFIQCTNGKNHTLTLKGYAGYKIKSISIHVKSNSSKGTGSFSVVAGSTTIASIAESAFSTANWNGSWNNSGVDKVLTMTNDSYEIQSGEDVKLTINCKSGSSDYNSLYIKSYTIVYESTSTGGETPEPETPATELTNDQFAWSAATAEATMGASNTFPTLTNTLSVPVTYESSTPATATINATSGAITLVAPSTTTISATFAGGEVSGTTYAAKTVSYTLTVKKAPLDPIAGGVIDILNQAWTGKTNSTYGDVAEKTAENTGHSNAKYVAQCAGDKSSIQLRSNNSNSGVVSTISGGVVKRIEVEWHADTDAARTLQIYGSNTAYTAATDLYGDAKGELLGELNKGEGETTLDFSEWTGDYKYIGFRSKSGAMYLTTVTITWLPTISKVTIDDQIENGSVSVSGAADLNSVAAGTVLTLSNTPATNYKLSAYDVYKTGDANTKVTVNGNTFVMPEFNVTISATFVPVKTLTSIEITTAATQTTFWQGETFNHTGLVVTAHFTGAASEVVTPTVIGSTATAGTQTVTVSYTEGTVTKTATYTIEVKAIPNTKETAYTVADAYDIIDKLTTANGVFIKGIVSQVDSYNETYKSITYWISDDGTTTKQLQVYSGKGLEGADFVDINGVSVEDQVIVYGDLKKHTDDTYEFNYNNYLVEHTKTTKADPELSYTTTEYNVNIGEPFTAPTLNNPHSLAVTYSSNNEDVATVAADGAVTIIAAGTVTITASFAGNEDYIAGETSYTITITNPPHTITWNVGGATSTTTVVDGAAVELPESPSSCSDTYTTFVGWYTVASGMESTPSATPQGEKVTASTVPTGDATYFAVWADMGDATNVVDVLNNAFTINKDQTNYAEWSDKQGTSGTIYKGNSAGGNATIQLRSSNSNSGIITTTSGGKAIKVVVSWNSETINGRELDIYGKNSAYTAATDLYDNNKQGTLLGSIKYGTSTELTIDGDYEYIGLRSASGAMYLDEIRITWSASSDPTGYISSCCQSPAVVTVTPTDASLELNIDGTASTTVNISQSGGGSGRYYEPTVSPVDGASLDWAALGVTFKQTAYDINFTATKAGTYTVTGNFTETAAGCSKTGSATINVAANPILQVSEPTITSECGTEGAPVAVQIDSRYLTGASLTAQVATTTDTEHGVFKICTTEDGDFATTDLTGLSAGKDDKATVTIYVRYDAALDNIDAATGTLTITDGTTSQTIDLATTPICGTSIRMTPTDANSVRVTTANGQWTRTQTAIHLRGAYLLQNLTGDQGAKVELTSSNSNFKFVKPDVASSGTTEYESEKITNNTWEADVYLVYTPTTYNANETTIITAKVITFGGTTEHATATMTAYGRSFPEIFVLALNTGSEWVALPADMIAPYGTGCTTGVGTHDPYPITVDNDANPTAATLAPARAVYKGAARNTPMTNPWTIQFESNTQAGYYLFGSNNTNTTIANTEQATGEGVKWALATEDNVTYQLSQTTTTNGQKLGYNGTNKTMGQYQSSASNFKYDFRILPVTATCTYYIEPKMTLEDFTDTEAKVRIQYDGTNQYQISIDNKANWTNIEGEIDCLDLTFTLNSTYRGKDVWLKPQGDLCEEVVSSVACHIPAPVITNPGAQAFKGTKNTDFAGVFMITGTDLYEDISAIYIKANSNPAIGVAINNGEVTVTMNAPAVGTYTTNLTFDAVGANEVTVPVTIEIQDLAVQEFDGGNGAFVEVDGVNVLCKDLIDGGITPEIYLSYPLFYEGNGIIETSQLNNTSFSLVEIETGEELSIIRGVPSEFNASVTLEATTLSKMIPGHTYRLSWENTNQVMTNAIGLPYMDCHMDFVYSENCAAPTALLACPITNSGFTANWVPKEDCTDNVTVDVYTRGAETTLIEKTTFSTTEVKDLQYAGESNLSGNYWITNIEGTKGGAPSISSNRLLISDVSEAEYYNLFSPLLSNLGTINESTIYTITVTLYQASADPGAGAYFYVMDNGNALAKNTVPTITDKSVTIDGQTTTYKKLTQGTTTFIVKGLSSDDRIRLLGFKTGSIASKSKNVYISSIKIEASGSITPVATKTISCNAGSAEFTGLTSNTQYYYTVTDGSSNTSNEIAVTTYNGEPELNFYSDEACTETITETLVLGGEKTTVYVSGTYVPGCEINTAVSSGYSMDNSGLIYTPTTGSVTGSIVLTLSDVNTTEGTLTLTDGKGNAYVLNINSNNCPTGFGSMALAASNINKTTATANWNNALNFGSPKNGTLHLYKNGEVNVEMIVNGDFETGSLEQGWSNTIHTGEGYQDVDAFETYIVKTNNDAHEGGSYLYVSEEGSGNKYDDFHDMPILYADYVDLLPGRYQMKAWAKMKPANGYNDKQQQFALGLISGDKDSRTVVCKSETMLVTSNNTYVELTYEFELQSIVRACPVIGATRAAGDFIPFYVDDVSLKRIKCPERGDEVQTIDIADLSAASSLDLTDLTPATEYTYVIQNAADCSSNEITFATDYSAIVQVHFSEDGTITSVPVDAETHKVTFEPTQSCAGRIFVGWSRDLVALTQTEPVGLVDLENETFTETTLLYAVYKSANGGKGNGISQVAFTEQFTGLAIYDIQNQNTVKTVQTLYTEWEYCYGRTRNGYNAEDYPKSVGGHVELMFYGTSSTYNRTQAYLRTTQKIEGLSQLSLYARVNSNVGNTFRVQVSENGTTWTDVSDQIIPGKNYNQYIITLPTPVDAYIRIITTPVTQFAGDATLNIDDIEIQTQARQFFYSDYATTCEGASSVAMTFDLNGGTAPAGKESDYEPKTTANTWHTLPAAPKKGDVPFLGWKVIDVPGYEMTFDAGEKYLLNHNVTLQAQWPTTEGDLMDIVDWNTNSVTINMNGYTITPEIQYYLQGNDASPVTLLPTAQNTRYSFSNTVDRTYDIDISSLSLTPGESLQLSVTMGADFTNQYYRVPYIYNASQTLPNTLTEDDDIVVRQGCLTIEGEVQVNAIYVYPTAELRIAGGATLTANTIYMRTNAFQSAVLTDNGILNVGQLYYTRIVADKQNSFLMALPFESTIADMRLTTGETKTYNKQWVLYTYDAAQRAETGATGNNWVKASALTHIQPHTSYELLSGSAYYREYCFPVAYTKTNANVDISVTAHTGAAAQADPIHGGWNAIASPYTHNFEPQWGGEPENAIKLTRLLNDNKTYYQYVPTIIEPATAFYYQTAQNATLQFTPTTLALQVPQAIAAKVAQREETDYPTQWINIVLSKQNDCQDQTNIYIHPDKFVTDYETSYDLTKMMGYGNRAQCYTTMPCGKLSFNALPLPVATNGINMGIYAPQTETLTLSITPNNYIQNVEQILLQDHYTNQTIDLLNTPYSFVAQPGEDEERFTIFIKCSATAITTDNAAQHNSQAYAYTQPKKLFLANLPRSGNIVIYDAVGKQIVQQRITQTNMDFVLPTGNYYVKVVNESEVQIIPTIVK